MRPHRAFQMGEYYHVFNRGADKRRIFLDDRDKYRFMLLMYLCNGETQLNWERCEGLSLRDVYALDRGEPLVNIGAWCLMFNHFHFLLQERVEGGISCFMQKVCTAYSVYFNHKHERTGPLFSGRYKTRHATTDSYLEYLYAYIHMNPVEHIQENWKEVGILNLPKVRTYLSNYYSSSYMDYTGKARPEAAIINPEAFPVELSEASDFRAQVDFWLKHSQGEELESIKRIHIEP